MAGGGGKEEGYVKRLLRAHSEEGEEGDGRLEEERRTMPSKEDSWVLRKKASFESMWGGGGSQSLSLCLPKQDYHVSKPAKEEKGAVGAFQVEEKVNEVENRVNTVIKEAAATVRAVAKEIDTDEIFGGADESSEASDLFREEEVEEEDENKDAGLQEEEGGTGSQSDSEEKGGDGLNEEAAAEEEVPTPAGEEAVTLLREKVGSGGVGCIQGGGAVPEGGAVDTVTREEAIR